MPLVSSEYLSALIQYAEVRLLLSFVMVNVGLLNRYTRLGGSGEIDEMMKSLAPRSMTLGHKEEAGLCPAHLYL
jgi:hypothetical protein